MRMLSKRVEVLFPTEWFERLRDMAQQKGTSVGELVRSAVQEKYIPYDSQEKLEAVERLAQFNAPIDDWEKMEEEIIKGAIR